MDFGMLMRKCMCLTLFFPDVTTTKSYPELTELADYIERLAY